MNAGSTSSGLPNAVFQSAVEAASTGVLITDSSLDDNPIVYANSYFQTLTGYAAGEILGKNCRFLQGPGTDRAVIGKIRECVRRKEEFRGEILNYRKDGSPFWNQLTISPVLDPTRAAPYFVGIQQDVTVEKTAAQERDRVIAELKAINQGLSRFSSMASHELKGPLGVISGFAEHLRDRYASILGREGAEHLERIRLNALHLSRCLEDLRQFGSLEFTPVDFESVNLAELLGEVVAMLGISAQESFVHFPRELPCVQCGRQLMTLAFRNLIDNAIKYGNAKERGVYIGGRLQPEGWCTIEVRDRGPGISAEMLGRVFEPFVSTATTQDMGSGLGLAIVKRIVEIHKGTVSCESSPAGTAFILRLPAH